MMLGDAGNYPLPRNVCPKLIIFLNSWTTFTFFPLYFTFKISKSFPKPPFFQCYFFPSKVYLY